MSDGATGPVSSEHVSQPFMLFVRAHKLLCGIGIPAVFDLNYGDFLVGALRGVLQRHVRDAGLCCHRGPASPNCSGKISWDSVYRISSGLTADIGLYQASAMSILKDGSLDDPSSRVVS